VREYFGETIAIYFAFLGYYTFFLAPPAILGVFTNFYVSTENREIFIVLFCVFNLVWATIFLESWKRKTAVLAYRWGTINNEQFEEPRAAFLGELGRDPVTGRLQPQYSGYRRMLKFYGVSVPVMLISLVIAWYVMLLYFYLEDYVKPLYKNNQSLYGTVLSTLPTIVYAFSVLILNAIYRPLAIALNRWENHRLQSAHDNYLITKLVVFNFANCFMSLFYTAFYLQDMELLHNVRTTAIFPTDDDDDDDNDDVQ